MKENEITIQELIPQRPPFLMVDSLLHFDMEKTVTGFTVQPDNVLVRDGHLSEAGLMENIAQSCAVRIGYINIVILKLPVRIGMIGSVKDMEISFLPPVGSRLETSVTLVSEIFNMTLVEAEVKCEGRVAATCQMKISLTDNKPED